MIDLGLAPGELQAVIFDFDGVILDNGLVKERAFVELFADYPEHSERILAHHRENLGVSRFDKFEWIYERLLRKPLTQEDSIRLGEAFSKLALAGTLVSPFVPGAPELLEELSPRLPLFVASGTPQEELDYIIERRGLRSYFRKVHGTPPRKEEVVKGILGTHQLDPTHVLLIGDGISDLDAAEQNSCRFVARIDHNAVPQPFPKATIRIDTLADLEGLLC